LHRIVEEGKTVRKEGKYGGKEGTVRQGKEGKTVRKERKYGGKEGKSRQDGKEGRKDGR
jgi:hypothetical protein